MKELKLNQLFNENTYKKALILNDNNINKSLDWIQQNVWMINWNI